MNAGPPSKKRRTKDEGELWDDGDEFSAEALENIDNLIASSQAPCQPSAVPRLVGKGTHRSHSAGEMGRPLQLREGATVPRVVRHPIIQPSRFGSASPISDSERQLQEKVSSLSRQLRDLQQSRDGQVTMLKNQMHEKNEEVARLRQEMAALVQTHVQQEGTLQKKCSSLAMQIDFKEQELQDAHSRRLQLQRQLQQNQKDPGSLKVPSSSPAKSNFPSTQSFMAQENSPRKTSTTVIACQTSPLKSTPQPQQLPPRSRRWVLKPSDQSRPSLLQHLLRAPSSGLQSLLSDGAEDAVLPLASDDALLLRLMPRIKAHLQTHLTVPSDSSVMCALHTLRVLLEHSDPARRVLLIDDPSYLTLLRDLSFSKNHQVSLSALTAASVLAKHSHIDNLQCFDSFLDRLPEAILCDGTEACLISAYLSLLSTLSQSASVRSLICSAGEDCLLLNIALLVRSKQPSTLSLAFIQLLSSLMSSDTSCLLSLSNNTCPCATALFPSLVICMHREVHTAHTDDASWAVLSRGFSLLHAQSLCHPLFTKLHSAVEAQYVQLICRMQSVLKQRQVNDELSLNALHELWDYEHDIPLSDEENMQQMDCSMNAEDFAEKVASLCHEKYASLPKKGKPQKGNREWTLMAAMVMTHHMGKGNAFLPDCGRDETVVSGAEPEYFNSMEVVSLATGTKCLSESKLKSNGCILHDSHAEILARRGFIRFLLAEIELCVCGGSRYVESTLDGAGKRLFNLKPSVRLHLFTSHTPCGDASIFPKSPSDDAGLPSLKRKNQSEERAKRLKTDEPKDIHRTGAKCVPGEEKQDRFEEGEGYHSLGLLRTKPGRGERTLSMSCSDKMAKWNVLGIQGALLSILMSAPVYLTSVIVGRCPYNEGAMKRALIDRISELEPCQISAPFRLNKPLLLQANQQDFEHSKTSFSSAGADPVASSAAVSWFIRGSSDELSVSVNGFKQGVTTKNIHKASAWSPLCKFKVM
ncbi:hypothetical protein CAPTEDRAFT_224434, partial [Capitella teleta]